MSKTITNAAEYMEGIYLQTKSDADIFSKVEGKKRRAAFINNRIKDLEANFVEAKTLHFKILAAKDDSTAKEKYLQSEIFNKLKELYFDYGGELQQAIIDDNTGPKPANVVDKSGELKLRNIELPAFSGGYENWKPFSDLYLSLVHLNANIPNIQKLHYLKTSLQGEAARLLQHISLEEKNYDSAWNILTERYENKRVLVNTQLRILLNSRNITTESAASIKDILDTTTECLHSLRNLSVPVDSWDAILIFILSAKLPANTQQLWEEFQAGSKTVPEFTSFAKFLDTRFRTLESVEQSQPQHKKFIKPNYPSQPGNNIKVSKNFHIGSQTNKNFNCRICSGNHAIRKCDRFLKMSAKERLDIIRKMSACTNCLAYNHLKPQCPSTKNCFTCNKRHHTLLHFNVITPSNNNYINKSAMSLPVLTRSIHHNAVNAVEIPSPNQPSSSHDHSLKTLNNNTNFSNSNINQNLQSYFTTNFTNKRVLLATALVNCVASNGSVHSFRALIDPGSEATFLTENAVQKLKLNKIKTSINVTGLGQISTGKVNNKVLLTILSQYKDNFKLEMDAYVFSRLTSELPSEKLNIKNWNHLNGLQLADPHFYSPGKIDILLGADAYSAIILDGVIKGPPGTPIAQCSELGWILSGHVINPQVPSVVVHHQSIVDLDDQLKRFWEIEELPKNRHFTEEEIYCQNHFSSTHQRKLDGSYEVCLPFKGDIRPSFKNSKKSAISRLLQLEKKFQINKKLKEMYAECITDYVNLDHMKEVQIQEDGECFYLPHHAVFKESTTTKLRVVFDASCKDALGNSLNNSLLTGPKLQNDLTGIIMEWRKFKIAFTADITKMYRQIWINPQDAMYQLICWRDEITSEIKTYALKTVTFGTSSAPYLAIRTLHQLADDEREDFPIASHILKNNFYVDDVMYGADSVQDAIDAQSELIKITNSAGFPLRKWASNNENILMNVPENEREINIPLNFNKDEYIKALGIQWHPAKDIFQFKINLPEIAIISKRGILSDIARLFDPIGWISPCILSAKLIMQDLWLQTCDWDDAVSDDIKRKWLLYRQQLPILENINIARWLQTTTKSEKIQLHGFSDASEKAYAAVVYLRFEDENEKIITRLVSAKTKVAPLKKISLPRLELLGAVLLAKLIKAVQQNMKFENIEICAWTDSMITLSWIQAHPSKWKTFVANRVTEIQSLIKPNCWNHVNSKDNPADVASRGLLPSEIEKCTIWWNGPEFLKKFEIKIPEYHVIDTELEKRSTKVLIANTVECAYINEIFKNYSNLTKLIRVISYLFRAAYNFKRTKVNRNISTLSTIELDKSLQFIIRCIQDEEFHTEKTNLINKNSISKNSQILTLCPFIDKNNIIRVGGRLENSNLSFDQKHPILLPRKSHLSDLIIQDAHIKTHHGGLKLVSAYIKNQYWILNAKNNIKNMLKKCLVCFRYTAKEATQLMGNLPASRVQISRPFYNTGVDYAGPLEIKAYKGRCKTFLKGYIAIFICLCTKAIHIELVTDLSSSAFIASFRRFTSRRGICQNIYSDCGTNFIGANNIQKREMKIIQTQWSNEVAELLSTMGTQWHFNPPASPHFGGLWEAGVKSIKYHLKRLTGNAKLTYEEYNTLLCQIEAALNSRPLCPLTSNIDDLGFLTPGHFLIMNSLNTQPEIDLKEIKLNNLDRWQYTQKLYQTFWDQWSSEYLSRLQRRPKWNEQHENIKIGDMVILKNEKSPPTHWQLARIVALHPGKDELIRVVTVKTAQGIFKRPVQKICLLPITDNYIDGNII